MKRSFTLTESRARETIIDVLDFIEDKLRFYGLSDEEVIRSRLMCEEAIVILVEHADFTDGRNITANVRKVFADVVAEVAVPGEMFDFSQTIESAGGQDESEAIPDALNTIRSIILNCFTGSFKFKHKGSFNTIRATASHSQYSELLKILCVLCFAVITGLLLRVFAPESFCTFIDENLIDPLRITFINGLKMCAVPIVFFSIASCMSKLSNLSGMRRISLRVLLYFVAVQCVAVFVGITLVKLLGTGSSAGLSASQPGTGKVSYELSAYIKDTITHLMPENIIRSFSDGNMLQLIVLAVFTGIAAGASGSKRMSGIFDELNNLFMKVTDILLSIVMLIMYCSVVSMIITTGVSALLSVIGIFWTTLLGYAVMFAIYFLAVLMVRLNPARLFVKSIPSITTALATCSNNAVMPYSLRVLQTMGVSRKVGSLSIPLGTALNKTAFCLYLGVAVASVANMYGVSLSGSVMLSVGVSIVIVGLGTPGMPGAGALSMLFMQAGCPLEAVTLLMSIEPILDIFDTATTAMSNLTMTLIAAKHEGQLDIETYNKKYE